MSVLVRYNTGATMSYHLVRIRLAQREINIDHENLDGVLSVGGQSFIRSSTDKSK